MSTDTSATAVEDSAFKLELFGFFPEAEQFRALAAERDARAMRISGLEIVSDAAIAERDALRAENARLREALTFYADPHKYPAPLTGGMGALWADCGVIARDVLKEAAP